MERKKDPDSIVLEIIKDQIFSINILGYDVEDTSKETINNVLWADELSQNIIYKLFIIIKSELEYLSLFMGKHDKFSCTSNLLVQRFHKSFLKKENLEESLNKKIKELEEYKFRTSKGLYKKYNKGEGRFEDITIGNIVEMIKSLRERRINIYKELLEDFKKNKEKYLDFMKKQDYTYV